ncbi:MAG: pitrilysin family protein [Acidobacteria bacterium]|nr:pitrilysin family protein [Acidobacteriota bacterium]
MRARALLPAALLAVVCLAAAGCGGSGPAEESTAAGAGFRAPESPIVNLRIVFRTGSIDDPAGLNGLNALTALMIGAGGTESLAYDELAQVLYPWSASISARYDKEVTTITGRVHRDHLEPFYAIVRDLIVAPRFDPADFERNRDRLRNGVVSTLRGNDDEELGKEALNALMYRGHPYEAPAMGTEAGLEAITLDDVRAFHASRYTRDNFLAGAGGGYPDGFVDRIESDLRDSLPAGGAEPAALPAPRELDGVELLVVEKQAIATAISIGFPIDVTRADDDFYPLLVANSYFGEHRTFNGLLMNVMRGARGLNYGDYSYIENFIQAGFSRLPAPNIPRRQQFFSIWIRPVAHHNAHFALRQALRELQRLVEQGLSQEDFEATRDFLINYSQLYVQTTDRRLGYLLDARFYESGFLVDEIGTRLPQLTVDDVNAAVRRHLRFDDLAVAVVTSDAEAFTERLLANQPSPPTYNTAVGEDILAEDAGIIEYPIPFNPDRVQIVPVREMFRAVE